MGEGASTFFGRSAALAGRHRKEEILGPLVAELGLDLLVAGVDTDEFGTFAGEVPRVGSPIQVAERKARAAIAATGLEIGLASEGSFGPHPELPFIQVDMEIVCLVDARYNRVIAEDSLGYNPPVGDVRVPGPDDLEAFLGSIDFGNQGVIVKPGDGSFGLVRKGITDPVTLDHAIHEVCRASRDRAALIEPDLRSHMCPTRRVVIREAAAKLVARLGRSCPKCGSSGFGRHEEVPGLPCRMCESPTGATLLERTSCDACGHVELELAEGFGDPGVCSFCNP